VFDTQQKRRVTGHLPVLQEPETWAVFRSKPASELTSVLIS
jgi:hypothetical protein